MKFSLSPSDPRAADAAGRFNDYVLRPSFPCVGARSALNRGRIEYGVYGALGSPAGAEALCDDLAQFSGRHPMPGTDPVSFVAMFDETVADEVEFEAKLWRQLDALHAFDAPSHAWNAAVSAEPDSADFSFSIAGRAFFVVGLSPVASRLARRAPFPCLVFNFHDQFLNLQETGKYGSMQTAIRKRDIALQGSINPVLARFGEASEARQYSGRDVPSDWQCPFRARRGTDHAADPRHAR